MSDAFDMHRHLAELEKLADTYAAPDGSELVLARHHGLPPQLAKSGLELMRQSFLLGALAASGLLIEGDADVPEAWLARNRIPSP